MFFCGGKRDMLLFQRKFRRQAFPSTRFKGRLEAAPNAELGMRNAERTADCKDMRRRPFVFQAEGLKHYSPGQRPGWTAPVTIQFYILF